MEKVYEINRPAVDDRLPDLTLLYDLDPETAIARRKSATGLDRIESEKEDFLRLVHEGFAARADGKRVRRIDATRSIEAIERDTHEQITRLLGADLREEEV